ncbi:MAG: hypothetical protein JXA28_07000 [Bacteroidetes bacterium]|nr:hypothetical protein [Bacteroidota bacterium]
MNGVQKMLVLGALTLLSILFLTLNRAQLFSDQQMSNAVYVMVATAAGQTLINEISTKSYDGATAGDEDAEVASFTAPGALGAGWWESYPTFNDVDDDNRFSTSVSTPRAGDFELSAASSMSIPPIHMYR